MCMMLQTWKTVAAVRGEWKTVALPLVRKRYMDDILSNELASRRKTFAQWLLGANSTETDVFVFGGIRYDEDVRVFCIRFLFLSFSLMFVPFVARKRHGTGNSLTGTVSSLTSSRHNVLNVDVILMGGRI